MKNKFLNPVTEIINKLVEKAQDRSDRRRMISLKPDCSPIGNVLISYILKPFQLKPGETIPNSHTHFWECRQMAKTFLDMGYCVDIIRLDNDVFIPQKEYRFFIENRWNLQRSVPFLNKDCIKIFHADTAHLLFHNAAEAERLLSLQQRKGVTLTPRRYEPPNQALENADYVMILGNEFTINTYKYANKPFYRIPISAPEVYPWVENKNFDKCRNNFLFFSSSGLVHKGLDLVLDAFAQMPEYKLTVCAPIHKEQDFQTAYYKELYQTPNINTVGWVDVSSPEFQKITSTCVGMVNPSCSEGGGGAVITCMHAGLIPIVSYESSVDIHDFGVIFNNCSVEEIKATVRKIANLSSVELEAMARKAWVYARANHTKQKFAQAYKETIENICKHHNRTIETSDSKTLLLQR